MHVKVVNMIPHSLSGEDNMDSEPSIAVNPANPRQIAASAFTPDPMLSGQGPIYVSTDGGDTWSLNVILPGGNLTNDITLRFASHSNILYAGILRAATFDLQVLRKINFTAPGVMTLLLNKNFDDQPYIEAATHGGTDRVYLGDNDFTSPPNTATVDASINAVPPPPGNFANARVEPRPTAGQDGPSIRPAIHHSGVIYAAYFGWRAFGIGTVTSDIVVARDDHWAAGPTRFQDLLDPDTLPGYRVAQGVTIPALGTQLGHQRIGSQLTAAVDPRHSRIVYIAWADGHGAADYTIHVRRSTDSGATWSADLRSVVQATNPQLAINAHGEIGFFYQKLHNPGTGNRWQSHLEISDADDAFSHFKDIILADIPDDNGTGPTLNPTNPLGDYAGLVAVGRTFYGVFCGNNTPDLTHFPHGVVYQRNHNFTTHQLFDLSGINPVIASYDPFFFKVWPRHEEEREEDEGLDFTRLEVEGVKYEKLEIKHLRLDLVDPRKKDAHALRRLGEELEALGKRLVSASEDEDKDKDKHHKH